MSVADSLSPPAGEVQRGGAEGVAVHSVLQPPSNPPDGVGQGGDGAPESGDQTFYHQKYGAGVEEEDFPLPQGGEEAAAENM